MRKEIAELVHPVITHALRLKEQLNQGDEPDFQQEQSKLRGLLKSEAEARRWGEFSGDPITQSLTGRRAPESFLGIRYALACWLDEIFLLEDSSWRLQWNDRKMETELYQSNDRAEKFWEQARLAAARPESDALEVYFLCVMLGFRGELRNQPDRLKAWRESAQTQIAQNQPREWAGPPESQPVIDVPPLHGARRFRTVMLTLAVSVLLLIPAAAFYLVLQLR